MGDRAAAGLKSGEKQPIVPLAAEETATIQRHIAQPVVQRTVWEWNGAAWVNKGGSSRDTDRHEDPNDKEFDDLEQGDRYDQNTGIVEQRARHARERLERAEKRQSTRKKPSKRGQELATDYSQISKKRGNRVVDATPFGSMRFGRGMYNTQPYGSLDPSDWPASPEPVSKAKGKGKGRGNAKKRKARSKSILTNYDVVSQTLEASGQADAVLQEIEDHMATTDAPQPSTLALSRPEQQAATTLSSLLSVAEPHEKRNPMGGKVERAAVRYARKEGTRKTFNRRNGAYVPAHAIAGGAKKGGTGAFRDMRRGDRPIPPATLDLLDHLSDSSADEAEKVVKKRPARRRKALKKSPLTAKRDQSEESSEEETKRKRHKKQEEEDDQ